MLAGSLISSLFLFVLLVLAPSVTGQDKLSASSDDESVKPGVADAVAAPVLTITPITWGVVGLDSNSVTDGPNRFPIGARVCNTGSTAATNVVSTMIWDTANANIGFRPGSSTTLTLASLAPAACTDFYYEIEVTRSTTSYNTTRRYRITATADTLGTVSTPSPREVYVEKLVSQNRNAVTGIKLDGTSIPAGGTMNMTVGGTYTIQLDASTATNGYEQIESFINLPNVVFQVLSVSSTYSAPTGYTGNKLYEDACGWDPNPANTATYRSCVGPVTVPGGKAGGTVSIRYTVKVISGGGTSATLNTLIYDFSGSSYHYNSDFSTSAVVARILPPPSAALVSLAGRVVSRDGYGITNAYVILVEADGTEHIARTGPFGYYRFEDLQAGQSAVVSVSSKRFTFDAPSRVVTLAEDAAEVDFVAQQ